MSSRFDQLSNRRAIIERRSLADALAEIEGSDATKLRNSSTALLKPALDAGRAEIAARLVAHPQAGRELGDLFDIEAGDARRLGGGAVGLRLGRGGQRRGQGQRDG